MVKEAQVNLTAKYRSAMAKLAALSPEVPEQASKGEKCASPCTAACKAEKDPVCDLPFSSTSYDATPPKHPDGKVATKWVRLLVRLLEGDERGPGDGTWGVLPLLLAVSPHPLLGTGDVQDTGLREVRFFAAGSVLLHLMQEGTFSSFIPPAQ